MLELELFSNHSPQMQIRRFGAISSLVGMSLMTMTCIWQKQSLTNRWIDDENHAFSMLFSRLAKGVGRCAR
jgi:hypothetical protein